jgi:agmatinase
VTRLGGMFGPDVTFLGVPRCDLEDHATFEGADVVIILEMLSGIAYRRQGGTWEGIPPTVLENR